MGFLEFLRGDRFLEDPYSTSIDEQRALPRPENELPLHVYRKTEQGRQRVTSGKLAELEAVAVAAPVALPSPPGT